MFFLHCPNTDFLRERGTGHEEMASSCSRRGSDWILGQFLHGRGGQSLEQAAQDSGESPSMEGLKVVWMWHFGHVCDGFGSAGGTV